MLLAVIVYDSYSIPASEGHMNYIQFHSDILYLKHMHALAPPQTSIMESISSFTSSSFFFLLPLLFLIFVSKLWLHHSTKHKNLPPSPLALPIIGHLHLMKFPMHQTLHALSSKYGRIFSLKFGSRLILVVSSPTAVEECFTKHDIVFANRPFFLLGKHFGYNYTSVVNSPYGDHWRNLRRICALEIFSNTRLNALLGIRKEEVKRLLLKLYEQSSSSSSGVAKVELKSIFNELTFNIIVKIVAGRRYGGDAEEARRFRALMKEALRYGGASNPGDFLPVLRWLDGGRFEKSVVRIAKSVDMFLQGMIEKHREKDKGDVESADSMLGHLLSLQKSQPEYYTDQIIKGLMLIMILAGTDTSATTLEWAMSELLNHPEILKSATDELDNIIGQEQLIDEPDMAKLHHIQNIVSETLRLHPAAPLLVPHMSSEDCTVCGYTIPRSTILLVNAWAIHRDPSLWADPTSFKPERFKSEEIGTYKLLPFGLGRRACPGAGLAQRVVGLVLGSIIQCFKWERVSKELVDLSEGRGITMPKVVPLEAICKPRPIMNTIVSSWKIE